MVKITTHIGVPEYVFHSDNNGSYGIITHDKLCKCGRILKPGDFTLYKFRGITIDNMDVCYDIECIECALPKEIGYFYGTFKDDEKRKILIRKYKLKLLDFNMQ